MVIRARKKTINKPNRKGAVFKVLHNKSIRKFSAPSYINQHQQKKKNHFYKSNQSSKRFQPDWSFHK